MENNRQISVSLEGVLEEAKLQRNESLDQILLLRAYVKELEEKNRTLEEKLNENGIVEPSAIIRN